MEDPQRPVRMNIDVYTPLALFGLDPASLVAQYRDLWRSLTPEVLADEYGAEPHQRWPLFLQKVLEDAVTTVVLPRLSKHCTDVQFGMENLDFDHGAWTEEHHERLMGMLDEVDQRAAGQLRLVPGGEE